MVPQSSSPWFAVQVVPRAEKRVAQHLTHKGYESFLPLYKSVRKWSDRKKVLELPLFPGYVFCRIREESSGLVMTTPGAIRIVGSGSNPCPIAEAEIQVVQRIVQSGVQAGPFPFLRIGERVEVQDGPLAGITGIIVQVRNQHRLVVSVNLVLQSISIDVDANEVRQCSRKNNLITAEAAA